MSVPPGSLTNPLPVAWQADRDARGASPAPRSPRCTEPGCPVRYASGPDRPCRAHRENEPDPRALALARAAPARDRNWPRPRELTPAERAELGGMTGQAEGEGEGEGEGAGEGQAPRGRTHPERARRQEDNQAHASDGIVHLHGHGDEGRPG
jgi:hypothetical protein